MPTVEQCLLETKKFAKEELSPAELDLLIQELAQVREARAAGDVFNDVNDDMIKNAEEIITRLQHTKAIEQRNKLMQIIADNSLDELADAANAAGDASLAVQAATVGTNTQFFGSRDAVDFVSNGLFIGYLAGFFTKVKRLNLLTAFLDKNIAGDIANELANVQGGLKSFGTNKEARAIAEIMHEVDLAKIATENRAGADIDPRAFRVARTTHNRTALGQVTPDAWADFIFELLDWKTMKVKPDDIAGFLRDVHKELTTGHLTDLRAADESDSVFAFTAGVDIAKRASKSRRLVFRTDYKGGPAAAWIKYNSRFGLQTFTEAWFGDLRRSSMNTALMRKFGHKPREAFDRWRSRLTTRFPDQAGKIGAPERLNEFLEIDGSTRIDAGETMLGMTKSALGRNSRGVVSMAALGNSGPMTLLDIPIGMSFIRMFRGGGFMGPLAEAFGNSFRGLSGRQTRAIASMQGLGYDVQVGEVLQRFGSSDNNAGRMAKSLQLFFKLNLMTPLTAANKRGMGAMLAKDMAKLPDSFDALPEQWKGILGTLGMGPREWAVARASIIEFEGHKLMLPAEVVNVGDIPALEGLSARKRADMLDDVRMKLGGFIADITDSVTLTPGARERAIFIRGMPRGSTFGEAARFIFQFKGPATSILTRVVGRQLKSRGAKTIMEAILKGEGDVLGLAWLIATLTIMGMSIDQLQQLAKGRETRPWDLALLRDGFVRGGAGGVYADFLFHESDRYGTTATSALAGPVPSILFDTVNRLRAKMMAGEADASKKEFVRFIRTLTPDLIWTQAALDYLIFYNLQEMVNPGYLERMERGFESERGQGFWLGPPSRVVKRGGGL